MTTPHQPGGLQGVRAILRRSRRTTCATCGQPAFHDPQSGRTYCGNKCDQGGRSPDPEPQVYQPGDEWVLDDTDRKGTRFYAHVDGIYMVSVDKPDRRGYESSEILTRQRCRLTGSMGWEICRNECCGPPQKVFTEAYRRAAWLRKRNEQ